MYRTWGTYFGIKFTADTATAWQKAEFVFAKLEALNVSDQRGQQQPFE